MLFFPESKSWRLLPILGLPGTFSVFGLWFFDERFDLVVMTVLLVMVLAVNMMVLVASVVVTIGDGSRFRTIMWASFVFALILVANWYFDLGLLVR